MCTHGYPAGMLECIIVPGNAFYSLTAIPICFVRCQIANCKLSDFTINLTLLTFPCQPKKVTKIKNLSGLCD